MKQSFARAAVTLLVLLSVGCGARLMVMTPSAPVLLPQAQQSDAMRAAIIRALQANHYTTEAEQPGQIIASYQRGGMILRVSVDYGPDRFQINYVDSVGMNYGPSESGQVMISRNYTRYVQSLQNTIQAEIGRPEREAREAAEAQARAQQQQQQAILDAQARERERDRQAAIEQERLRAQAAQAQASAQVQVAQAQANAQVQVAQAQAQPVIVDHRGYAVAGLAFNPAQQVGSRYGGVALQSGFMPDPHMLQGQALGNVSFQQLGMPRYCRGYYSSQPEHVLQLNTSMGYFRIEGTSSVDTTLAIVAPDGTVYCDDDGGEGLNPRIAGQFPAGTYLIYVGTYQANHVANYSLQLSELQPGQVAGGGGGVVVVRPGQQQPQVQAVPDCRTEVLNHGHSASSLIHCSANVEPFCAQALLNAGHNPSALIHCQGVNAQCAVTLLQSGRSPSGLIHCR